MKAIAAFAAAFLSLSPHALADDGGVGRYQITGTDQIIGSAQIVVIDTKTGELWFMKESEAAGYAMHPVCYLGSNGYLTPMPDFTAFDGDDRDCTKR